jgi:hypothetical protein
MELLARKHDSVDVAKSFQIVEDLKDHFLGESSHGRQDVLVP